MPLELSAVFHLTFEHPLDLLAMASLSPDHFDVDTNDPHHASNLLMMQNEHILFWVASSVHQ